ncbi:MAG: hypothetical protein GY801_42370 [bacterium]|nr:hypothetical protein [bacterium]
MLNTLEKVKRLEQYLGIDDSQNDPVIDRTITKLLLRESGRMGALCTRLSEQIQGFEKQYDLSSLEFHDRYVRGDMGDDMDFIEWASTLDMLANAKKRLTILESHSTS